MTIEGQIFTELKGKLRGYWVNAFGDVASTKPTGRFKSKGCRDIEPKEGHILSQRINKYGYCDVGLRFIEEDGTKRKVPYQVHRLVAAAYLRNEHNLPQVNHKDGNKSNNNINNLEWCTARYNVQDGVRRKSYSQKGQNNVCSKLKDKDIPLIMNYRRQGLYVKDIAKKFNVSKSTIQNVVSGYQWNHLTGLPNKKEKYTKVVTKPYES